MVLVIAVLHVHAGFDSIAAESPEKVVIVILDIMTLMKVSFPEAGSPEWI